MFTRHFLFLSLFLTLLSGCNLIVHTTGEGTVTFDNAQPKKCSNSFLSCFSLGYSDSPIISAHPANGFAFSHWEGDCTGSDTCSLSMNKDHTVRAVFNSHDTSIPEFKPKTDHFFSAPWPNDAYSKNNDGSINLSGYPFEKDSSWGNQIQSLAKETTGFSTNGGTYFQFSTLVDNLSTDDLNSLSDAEKPAYIINLDNSSEKYGALTPATIQTYHKTTPTAELHNLLMVAPKPGYPLLPSTTYGVLLFDDIPLPNTAPSTLLQALDSPYSPTTNISSELFNTLKNQKHLIESVLINYSNRTSTELIAFTVFTTQNPLAIDQAIGNSFSDLSKTNLLDSINFVERIQECWCDTPSCVEAFTINTQFPRFLGGKAPYILGGGNIDISDNKALVKNTETINLLVKVPCDQPKNGQFPLITHAIDTTENWLNRDTEDAFRHKRAIEVLLDAPESDSRRSPVGAVIEDLMNLVDISPRRFFQIVTDFNFLNLRAAKNSHIQYGADLAYAQKIGQLLPEILDHHSITTDKLMTHYQHNPDQLVLSGRSLGAIAISHALAMGAQANMVTLEKPPRPSYLHIAEIASYIEEPKLLDYMVKFSGIDTQKSKIQPLSHLVQTVLEPMDTMNYVHLLNVENMYLVLSTRSDKVHGGDAAFSIATRLENITNAQPIYEDESHMYDVTLDESIHGTPLFSTYRGFNNGKGNQFISVEQSWLGYDEALTRSLRCFSYDTFTKETYDAQTNFVAEYDTSEQQCH
ncbi:MAG: hypothetical protein KUG73_05485 [Pseudomonadales bacterium]|nr:hypothetical protein [Pseudomonadales bacterium]